MENNTPEQKPDHQENETQEQLMDALITEYRELRKSGGPILPVVLILMDKYTITRKPITNG